jgi:hypothetical protein
MAGRAGLALLVLVCATLPAAAGPHCRVPLSEWQPREALQAKLEAQGWTVLSIRTDDGCYKVQATDANGERLAIKVNPKTLEPATEANGGDDVDADD